MGAPFTVIADIPPSGQRRCWLVPGACEEVTQMGCNYKSANIHLTKTAAKLFASDLRLSVNRK